MAENNNAPNEINNQNDQFFKGYDDEITEQMRRFMRMITVYLTAILGMSSAEIKEKRHPFKKVWQI